MPDEPVPDDAAGLRAANARLRALLAERDAEIAVLRGHLDELTALQAEARELRERGTRSARKPWKSTPAGSARRQPPAPS